MNVLLNVLVGRLNGKTIFAEGIVDSYTFMQFQINSSDLDDVSKQALLHTHNHIVSINDDGFYFNENEVKDMVGTYGNLVISVDCVSVKI